MSDQKREQNYIVLDDEFDAQREQHRTRTERALLENWYRNTLEIRSRKKLNLSQILGQK